MRQRPWWWWALWMLLGLAMGVQALRMSIAQAAVDNLAGARAAAARPQNGWGQALLAEKQLASGHVDAAIETSRIALSETPLAVIAARTLAQSLDSKSPAGGEPAWQVASTMGWRDPQTQLWALLRALSNGQADIFVMRADALLRGGTDDPRMLSVVRQALIEPRMRQAFLQRISLDPEWRLRLFTSGHRLAGGELEGTLLALRGLARSKAPPERQELRDTILGLLAEGRVSEAVALDRQFVARKPDRNSLIDDGGFGRLNDYQKNVTPFDWVILKRASIDQSAGQKSMLLAITSHGPPLVQRLVPLAPGNYRLSYAIRGQLDSPNSIGIIVRCAGNPEPFAISTRDPLPSDAWQRRSFDFAVPDTCPLVMLQLTGFRGAAESEAQFDDITINRIG